MVVPLDFYWLRKSNKSLWFWPFCCVTLRLKALGCRGKVCHNQPLYLKCKHNQNTPQNTQRTTQFQSTNTPQWTVAALTTETWRCCSSTLSRTHSPGRSWTVSETQCNSAVAHASGASASAYLLLFLVSTAAVKRPIQQTASKVKPESWTTSDT